MYVCQCQCCSLGKSYIKYIWVWWFPCCTYMTCYWLPSLLHSKYTSISATACGGCLLHPALAKDRLLPPGSEDVTNVDMEMLKFHRKNIIWPHSDSWQNSPSVTIRNWNNQVVKYFLPSDKTYLQDHRNLLKWGTLAVFTSEKCLLTAHNCVPASTQCCKSLQVQYN